MHSVAGAGVNVWGLPPPLRDLPTSPGGQRRPTPLRKKKNRKSRPGREQNRKSRLWTGEGRPETPHATPRPY